ncbi:LTA synthase family protein [Sediminitomix flava]|uniref:Phosphoglycerol transferase MdoB-like AlkP superfamily enzyme n=1 Tax=Sediminitomix flava TaxID=379075 RepID=A0A315ZHK9_SEDFL|nr:alkaline phosphatase family protein [Sediminitomix flava]PWJ45056.1 phosphoglycerol transferase MdoB-like AlkP superfamily enzyme [Sediminitomix flava]
MQTRLTLLLKNFFFWLVFFQIGRFLFIIYQLELSINFDFSTLLKSMFYGARMDMSVAGYMSIIPALMLTISALFKPQKWVKTAIYIHTFIFMILSSLTIVSDMELYSYWNYRMDATPLLYLSTGFTEVIQSASPLAAVKQVFLFALMILAGSKAYNWLTASSFDNLERVYWSSPATLVFAGLLIIPIRGSFDVAPMNVGFVYFHEKPYPNHVAINVFWNVLYSLGKVNKSKYPENFYDKTLTEEHFAELYEPAKTRNLPTKLLKTDKPNVILIILESFTADLVESLGGEKGVTPNLEKLIDEGVLFTNVYANGDRTDKGLVAVLSSYPAQPKTSMTKWSQKTQELPSLPNVLNNEGYHTSFFYGGDVNFANINSYLHNSEFQEILSKNIFPSELSTSKWGVHDHYVFDKAIDILKAKDPSKPFFQTILTSSSHEPFDVPMETVFEGDDKKSLFMNSAHYTDRSLGVFIDRLKEEKIWDNTLIMLVADHGIPHIKKHRNSDAGKFHIPMIWTGGALQNTNLKVDTFGNQTDLAETFIRQLNVDYDFVFGKDLLQFNDQGFSFFTFNNGFGYLTSKAKVIYDLNGDYFISKDGKNYDQENAKAYMQKVFTDFNNR